LLLSKCNIIIFGGLEFFRKSKNLDVPPKSFNQYQTYGFDLDIDILVLIRISGIPKHYSYDWKFFFLAVLFRNHTYSKKESPF